MMRSTPGDGVVRLRGPWDVLGLLLPVLGRVRVLEGDASWTGGKPTWFSSNVCGVGAGAMTGEATDARTVAQRWRHGFAVAEEIDGLAFRSLQFLDATGVAVHRIYLTDDSNPIAWAKLVTCFRAPLQSPLPEGFTRRSSFRGWPQLHRGQNPESSALPFG